MDQPCQTPLALLPTLINLPVLTSVKRYSIIEYYGTVDSPFLAEVVDSLASRTDADPSALTHFLSTFINLTHNDCPGKDLEKSACWLAIRSTRPSDEWKVPRWHKDGRMYNYDAGREDVVRSKYAITLLGPQTLMLPNTPHIHDTFNNGETQHFYWRNANPPVVTTQEERSNVQEKFRTWLAEQYKDEEKVEMVQGQVVRFSWGHDDSPVHSEPDFVSDRVFMSILYGSEKEIRDMCSIRDEVYGKVDVFEPKR